MRAREFASNLRENASVGATAAGGIAPVQQALGQPIKRLSRPRRAKYQNSAPSWQGK
jgi:hypothetical protein